MNYLHLGASLYVPSTHCCLLSIANQKKYPDLKSVIFCTEDAIKEIDLKRGLNNIEKNIAKFEKKNILRFIRPRNTEVFKKILTIKDIKNIDGFVFPKISEKKLFIYKSLIAKYGFKGQSMLTLETKEVFNPNFLEKIARILSDNEYKNDFFNIRVGSLDLLNILGIKKGRGITVYDTPLRKNISEIVEIFKPLGYNISGSAYEYFKDGKTLKREIRQDFNFGLFGKTAIHPLQVKIIQNEYKVNRKDYKMALKILEKNASSVFKFDNSMCEISTHHNWARQIIKRAEVFGLKNNLFNFPQINKNFLFFKMGLNYK